MFNVKPPSLIQDEFRHPGTYLVQMLIDNIYPRNLGSNTIDAMSSKMLVTFFLKEQIVCSFTLHQRAKGLDQYEYIVKNSSLPTQLNPNHRLERSSVEESSLSSPFPLEHNDAYR